MSKEWNFQQELTGCFGQPVRENPTQYMIEAAYKHHGLDWRYITMECGPEGLADAVRGVQAVGFRGFNCTIPHKVAVIEHLDRLGDSASVMGAVNCVVVDGDELVGENTDGKGFLESLKEITDPSGKSVAILGAGGAARAISVELAIAGATQQTIVNRSQERGEELTKLLNEKTDATAEFVLWDKPFAVPESCDMLINATSIGLFPDIDARVNIDVDTLRPDLVVADVIPNPPKTNLVKDATAKGCQVIDGLKMLVGQGVIGLKYWTGIDVDASVMRAALEEVFGSD
ncbi:MAG: shikimate dehydrogenase [Planctomycetota bacterium]